jgi:OTU domain-containing protein 5
MNIVSVIIYFILIFLLFCIFKEPINIVHGMYKTDNEPIRLSYHCSVHYNSIIDPWRPTAGHGLGLPDLEPGVWNRLIFKIGFFFK